MAVLLSHRRILPPPLGSGNDAGQPTGPEIMPTIAAGA